MGFKKRFILKTKVISLKRWNDNNDDGEYNNKNNSLAANNLKNH